MIRAVVAFALILATPASALTVDQLEGRWRGEGALTLENEPEQRFSCRIRLRTLRAGESFFSGRCASAQAAQSFTYMLFEQPDGTLTAENRAEAQPDTTGGLPLLMAGQASPGRLLLGAEDGAIFELRLEGETLIFRIEGNGPHGLARGTARLSHSE